MWSLSKLPSMNIYVPSSFFFGNSQIGQQINAFSLTFCERWCSNGSWVGCRYNWFGGGYGFNSGWVLCRRISVCINAYNDHQYQRPNSIHPGKHFFLGRKSLKTNNDTLTSNFWKSTMSNNHNFRRIFRIVIRITK